MACSKWTALRQPYRCMIRCTTLQEEQRQQKDTCRSICCNARQLWQRCRAVLWNKSLIKQTCRSVFCNRRSLIIVLTYCLTFLLVLPIMCRDRCVFSPVYSPALSENQTIERIMHLNQDRLQAARIYINYQQLLHREDKPRPQSQQLTGMDIIVSVVTMKRHHNNHELGYLTQAVIGWHKVIKSSTSLKVGLVICNVDPKPSDHMEAVALSGMFTTISKYATSNQLQKNHLNLDKYEKEKVDYLYCLKEAEKRAPKYVLVAEDDALPETEIFDVIDHVLRVNVYNPNGRSGSSMDTSRKWGYIKLYFPESWRGFSWAAGVGERLGFALLTGSLFYMTALFCRRRRLRFIDELAVFAAGAGFGLLFLTVLGRQHFLEWRRLSKYLYEVHKGPHCCTQAVMYPTEVIDNLTTYMTSQTCTKKSAVDLKMAKFFRKNNLTTFYIEPHLVRHIGMVSAMGNVRVNGLLDYMLT